MSIYSSGGLDFKAIIGDYRVLIAKSLWLSHCSYTLTVVLKSVASFDEIPDQVQEEIKAERSNGWFRWRYHCLLKWIAGRINLCAWQPPAKPSNRVVARIVARVKKIYQQKFQPSWMTFWRANNQPSFISQSQYCKSYLLAMTSSTWSHRKLTWERISWNLQTRRRKEIVGSTLVPLAQ